MYDCSSRVKNILPVCSYHLKMCFIVSTYPPFKLNAFDTTGPRNIRTRRLHRRSLRLPTRRKWAQSGYLCTTPSTAHAEADAGISWS